LRRCTERTGNIVDFYLFLAARVVVTKQLVRAAFHTFRWSARSNTRRLRKAYCLLP
jgi:hypothetical protein